MKAERIVVDTSILISAALSASGKPAIVVDFVALLGTMLFSRATFDGLATRLFRPKFDRYVSSGDRQTYLEKIASVAHWIEITGVIVACRDPGDDKVLETAVIGAADCIVTGDQDLLALNPFRGIPILTAAEFMTQVINPPV